MKRRVLLVSKLLVAVALMITGCAKKVDDGKIPITTSSEEAKKEFIQGRDLAENLRFTNSIQHFDKAIALDTNFASAYLNRALVATNGTEFFDNLKKAVAAAGKASEGERLLILANEAASNANVLKQRELLEQLVAKYPKDERAHFNLGGYYYGQQDYNKAIAHYRKAAELAPGYAPVYNILGYANRQVGNFPEAEKNFKKYIELIPHDPNPHDSYAELLMKMGRYDESIVHYRKALAIDPYFAASRSSIAVNYMYKGVPDSGAMETKKAFEMARNDGERRQALFTQMAMDVDAGNMADAMKMWDQINAYVANTNDVAQITADLTNKANMLCEMNKFDDALAVYEKVVALTDASDMTPEFKENTRLVHHYNVGMVAVGKKDLKKAKSEADKFFKGATAIKNQFQLWQAHSLLGMIALAEKKYDAAVEEFRQANMQNPQDIFRLGLGYLGKGDKTTAKEYFMKAAQFNGLAGLNAAFVRKKAMKMAVAL